MPGRVAPPGVSRPSSDFVEGIRMTRACLARHHPSSRSLTVPTVCSPFGLADTLGPLPLLGFSLAESFRTGRPGRLATSTALRRPRCSTPSNSEEYEVGSSAAEKERLSRSALVPRPWFQDSRAPFEAHHPRTVPRLSSRFPLTRLSPRRLGEPYRVEPAPQGLPPIQRPADLREIRSFHGVPAASGRRSGAFRCSPPSGTGMPDRAGGFQGVTPSGRSTRLPGPNAPSMSPNYQRAIFAGSTSRRSPTCQIGRAHV